MGRKASKYIYTRTRIHEVNIHRLLGDIALYIGTIMVPFIFFLGWFQVFLCILGLVFPDGGKPKLGLYIIVIDRSKEYRKRNA